MPETCFIPALGPALGKDEGVQLGKLAGVPWGRLQERQMAVTKRRDHEQTRTRAGSAGGFTSGGLR